MSRTIATAVREETINALLRVTITTAVLVLATAADARDREPIVGGPCERCEGVFVGLPELPPPVARIAPPGEPGEPMRIEGVVRDGDGSPVGGVIVYAYHTDAGGIYPRIEALEGTPAYRHGRLRAWARTDERGRYRFDTIRPASYPDTRIPQHVHMHIIEPGRCTYSIDSIEFLDDPLLPERARTPSGNERGGNGVVMPEKDDNGTWLVTRDIMLGENVSGYPARNSP